MVDEIGVKDTLRLYDKPAEVLHQYFRKKQEYSLYQAITGADNSHTPLDLTLIFLLMISTAGHHTESDSQTPHGSNLHDLNQDNTEQSFH